MSDLKNDFKEIGSAFKKVAGDVVDKAEEVIDEYDLDEKAKSAGKAITDTSKTVAKELGEVADDVKDNLFDFSDELGKKLKEEVDLYNIEYSKTSDYGFKLLTQRERSLDLLDNVEDLINSIANTPKSFETDFEEINVNKKDFRQACDFAKKELDEAKKSAAGAGAGMAAGATVAALAPSAAMWIATTFGVASTGTAISALSGAAAANAAMAWLGGGTLAAGGGGAAAGQALLALAGPIGWSIAGFALLTSIVLFAKNKMKISKDKKKEIEAVMKNTEQLKEINAKIHDILEKTTEIRENLKKEYSSCIQFINSDYKKLEESQQAQLGTLVNNAKSLAHLMGEKVEGNK